MLETTYEFTTQEDLCSAHVSAFSEWLETKITLNESRKNHYLQSGELATVACDAQPNGSHRPLIVVVDDEPHIAITLSEILERRDYRTIWFTEPGEALAVMHARRPDLLLTDVNMPMLDGFDLALGLWRRHPDCPVLIISAVGDDSQLLERVAAAGVSIALETKPVHICALIKRITELLSAQPHLTR